MDRRDLLPYHKAFRDLIDKPEVFDLVVDIMGPYILFSMSQAIVRASTDTFPGYTHTDGGEGLRRIRVSETSRPLAMKAMYLLSDVEGHEAGNFTVFPGSHLRRFPEDNSELTPHTPGASNSRARRGIAICSVIRFGMAPRLTIRARVARRCSITTARCSCAVTIWVRCRTWLRTARCANAGCSATSATTSGRVRISMFRKTRKRLSTIRLHTGEGERDVRFTDQERRYLRRDFGSDPVKENNWVKAGKVAGIGRRRTHGARDRRCGRRCGDAWICGSAHLLRRAGHFVDPTWHGALAGRHHLVMGN